MREDFYGAKRSGTEHLFFYLAPMILSDKEELME